MNWWYRILVCQSDDDNCPWLLFSIYISISRAFSVLRYITSKFCDMKDCTHDICSGVYGASGAEILARAESARFSKVLVLRAPTRATRVTAIKMLGSFFFGCVINFLWVFEFFTFHLIMLIIISLVTVWLATFFSNSYIV